MRLTIRDAIVISIYLLLVPLVKADDSLALPTITASASYATGEYKEMNMREPHSGSWFRYQWRATNCDYVLVLEQGKLFNKYGPEGHFDRFDGGTFTFLAVGRAGISKTQVEAGETGRPGPGRYGLLFTPHFELHIPSYFMSSYVSRLATNASIERIRDTSIKILQKRGFQVTEYNDIHHQTNFSRQLVLFTSNFTEDRLLLSSHERTLPDNKRKIQRQIALSFLFEQKVGDKDGRWTVRIRSEVVRRYVKDGGDWFADDDFAELAIPVCAEIIHLINQQLQK